MRAKTFLCLATILGGGVSALCEEAVIPKNPSPDRYERIWKKSPFTVASIIAPGAVNTANFTDNLSLVGLMTIGNKPLVTVVSTDSQQTQLIDSEKPNAAGLIVSSFVNNLDPSKVEVVLKQGDASGTLHFVINETPAAHPESINPALTNNANNNGAAAPRFPGPNRVLRPNGGNPGPRIAVPGQPSASIIRRRSIALPGANRPQNNPQSQTAPKIPPP